MLCPLSTCTSSFFLFCCCKYWLFDFCLFHSRFAGSCRFRKETLSTSFGRWIKTGMKGSIMEESAFSRKATSRCVSISQSELQPSGSFVRFFSAVLPHSPIPYVCSSFHPQRKPSQRKASQYRCWNTGRPSPASTSQGTQLWRCPSERCGVASPSSACVRVIFIVSDCSSSGP